jgi:hypothetical protein
MLGTIGLGGQDLLIGGPTSSQLNGTGSDILIGGTTLDDRNMAALEAVLSTWTDPTADYATRVSRPRSGALAAGRVSSNNQPNSLLGGTGPHLILASPLDTTNKAKSDWLFKL